VRNDLRQLREARGWTQAAVADRLGVSRQTVNALETGRYDPSLPLAFRLAELFERPIEQLFHPGEDEVRPPAAGSARPAGGRPPCAPA
jgi:putative transcriptional regulator